MKNKLVSAFTLISSFATIAIPLKTISNQTKENCQKFNQKASEFPPLFSPDGIVYLPPDYKISSLKKESKTESYSSSIVHNKTLHWER